VVFLSFSIFFCTFLFVVTMVMSATRSATWPLLPLLVLLLSLTCQWSPVNGLSHFPFTTP